ncbi:MAG: AAA family ATPase, partial [Polyangiaceae bacterium]
MVRFKQCLASGTVSEATLMLRKGFASIAAKGLDESFAAWRQGVESDLARRLRVEARSRLEQSVRLQDWDRVRDAAEALHCLDPTDASVAAQLIEALGRLGHTDLAERALAEFLEARRDQSANGIVQNAITRVRTLRLGTEALAAIEMPLVPLFGRSQALGVGKAAFQRALDGAFPVVVITGESGIGKTRVLRELMGIAELDGFRCLGVRSTEPEQRLPLNSLLDGLEGVELDAHLTKLGPPWNSVLSSVLPSGWAGSHPWPPPQVSDGVRVRRLFVALTLLFEQLAREQPTILFIDDLQWADETTVTALHFMRRRWKTGAFGVIAAQTENPGYQHSEASLSTYWDRSATFVHLTELSANDALRLVMHVLGQEVDPEMARKICALAGPNPLFLTEVAREVRATGSHVDGPTLDEISIPTSLKQLLDSRLAPLSNEARAMAGVLAVAARPLGLEMLARACGADLQSALHVADELQRTGLVEWKADRACIAHDLFRQALYDELGQPRRAMIHRTLAAQLHWSDGDSAAAEVAHHYASAGEQTLACAFGRLAADNAMRTGAVEEAAHLFRIVADYEGDLEKKADATAACARALFLARDIAAAEPFFDLGIERLREVGRIVDAARLEIRFVEGLA